MIFFGSILSADELSPTLSSSAVENITTVTVSNAYYDDVYITENTDYELSSSIPADWDFDTVMHATYDKNLSAGNVDFTFEEIKDSYLIIRRRISDTFNWITLQAYLIEERDDLNIKFTDYTAAPGTEYEYAAIPVLQGFEGSYYTSIVTPETDKLVIVDRTAVWATIVTDGFANSKRNSPPGVIEPINSKYATIVHNGMANYDTVTVTAGWFPTDEDNCTLMIGEEYNAWVAKYAKQFMDFLTNKQIRMLKNVDGRMWLGYTTTLPSNNARDTYWDREITFGLTEIADVEDERVLYDAGLIDAPEQWWSS